MNILKKVQSHPAISSLTAIIIAVATIAGVSSAWGPDRPTYTVSNPASHVTFNSMTDNPVVGDERDFVSVKDAGHTQAGGWKDTVTAEPGKEYLVRIYVHNNAAASMNLDAINTRVQAAIGTNTGKKVSLTGYVSADNAQPQKVYDDIHFTSNDVFNLAYVPGSAMIYNNATGQAGRALSDSIVDGSGAQIGYESNDGKVPGCFEFVSYVTFKVKPQFAPSADFDVEKSVRLKGETKWNNSIQANPGDDIQYRVLFQNTADAQLDNTMLFDQLPAGVSYVKGSTRLYLASDPNNARPMPDGITEGGLNIGSYGKNGLASVIFDAKVAKNDALKDCGVNTLKNIVRAETNYGSKEDDAVVTVTKKCQEPPKPKDIEVCRLTDKKVITIKENEFDSDKHSKNLDDCKETPQPQPKDIEVCNLGDKKVITIKEDKFDSDKHSKSLDDCKETPKPVIIKVCEVKAKNIIEIDKKNFDDKKHSKNLDDCKETPEPSKVEVCNLETKDVTAIYEKNFDEDKHSKDLSKCDDVTPTPPTKAAPVQELPKTGLDDVFTSALGIGSLAIAAGYYINSRRFMR